MITMQNICKSYILGDEELHVLNHVDLEVADREFLGIVGPSGSGKSTLMNIIGCLDLPDEGNYYLDGVDIPESSDKRLAKIRSEKIGFVFQQFNLISKLNAIENVELPLLYQGVGASEAKRRAIEELEKVGLSDRLSHRPNELSGGQQQRVAIARAIVTKPALILADEPTGNLDSRSGKEIMRLLSELHENGNTIVLITHDTQVAAQTRRRIYIRDGYVSPEDTEIPTAEGREKTT